jgi:hypothetical protein
MRLMRNIPGKAHERGQFRSQQNFEPRKQELTGTQMKLQAYRARLGASRHAVSPVHRWGNDSN